LSREEADGHEILFKIDYYDKTLTLTRLTPPIRP
jgi:hypothetical protein